MARCSSLMPAVALILTLVLPASAQAPARSETPVGRSEAPVGRSEAPVGQITFAVTVTL